ncbi:MAG: hypothetical protein QXM31_02880 [Candidatus Woesearchaeota archaeon]
MPKQLTSEEIEKLEDIKAELRRIGMVKRRLLTQLAALELQYEETLNPSLPPRIEKMQQQHDELNAAYLRVIDKAVRSKLLSKNQ